jgi:hypothetical protein
MTDKAGILTIQRRGEAGSIGERRKDYTAKTS